MSGVCRQCGKAFEHVGVTCGKSECQEAEYHANAQRGNARRAPRKNPYIPTPANNTVAKYKVTIQIAMYNSDDVLIDGTLGETLGECDTLDEAKRFIQLVQVMI